MALISICIPTFNGARYLASCLESALAQTARDFEIVVNDDGSTDDTLRIANEFARGDSRIRVYRNDGTLGLVGNWNRTIEKASSPWIKLLFQDDTLHQDCLAELHALSVSAGLPFVGCFRHVLFDDSVSPETRAWFAEHLSFVAGLFAQPVMRPERVARTCLDHFALNFVGEPIVTMLHRRVFEDVGYFDPALSQRADTEFWYRAGLRHGIGMVCRPLATFRFHRNSASTSSLMHGKYVDEQLDPLIIRYRCLFDEHYALVRRTADDRDGQTEMKRLFRAQVRDASLMARQDLAAGNRSSWEAWHRVVAAYPKLDMKADPRSPGI